MFPSRLLHNIWPQLAAIALALLFVGCRQQPTADTRLFRQMDTPTAGLELLLDTAGVVAAIEEMPPAAQVDSLLVLSVQLQGYDPSAGRFYAERAYSQAKLYNWGLQRAISLYYIALMKRRLQTYGGGIEDAQVDAEMSRLLFERLGRKDWLVRVYDLMGIIHFRQYEEDRPMKLDTARAYFQRALATLKTIQLPSKDSIALIAEIQHDLGTTYELNARDTARMLFDESYENYARIGNELGLSRLRLAIGNLLEKEKRFAEADSLYHLSQQIALANNNKQLLREAYYLQSISFLDQYRQTKDPELFESAIKALWKRMEIQKNDKYHSYERLGISYKSKAVSLYLSYRKQADPDSARHYFSQAYTYVDSALLFYKTAIEDAQSQGVLSVMDNLAYNILTNCEDKKLEGQGDCKNIFGEEVSKYISKSYKMVADLMTVNLTQANQRIREMERLESDRLAARQRRELLLIGLAVLLFAAILFLLFLQRAERRKLKAEMDALRAQINPHFISNSLNAIESLVNLGQNEAAAKYLIHFSRLSRRILNGSRNPQATLADELDMLKHFLTLEQLRFRDKLHFEIELAEGLQPERIEVPAMILQPYVENAIWHGIKPKPGPGTVKVFIERRGNYLACSVEDNGIGREKSGQLQAGLAFKHKSQGMQITEERLRATGKVKGSRVEVIDLHDTNGQATGTRVIVRLPFKLKKNKND